MVLTYDVNGKPQGRESTPLITFLVPQQQECWLMHWLPQPVGMGSLCKGMLHTTILKKLIIAIYWRTLIYQALHVVDSGRVMYSGLIHVFAQLKRFMNLHESSWNMMKKCPNNSSYFMKIHETSWIFMKMTDVKMTQMGLMKVQVHEVSWTFWGPFLALKTLLDTGSQVLTLIRSKVFSVGVFMKNVSF